MANVNDGEPAFPVSATDRSPAHCGMTLRDWFAGQALTAIIPREGWVVGEEQQPAEVATQQAYIVADAMIAARTKGQ